MADSKEKPNTPYCGNCGYELTGLVDSSKCPECGRPMVDVLIRRRGWVPGTRYASRTQVFGLPLLATAYGPSEDGSETRGHAVGVVALGDIATGVIAVGGVARGVVAVGGLAMGVVALGGLALGLLCGIGGLATGLIACGGQAVGAAAQGGGALGVLADGGGAVGWFARGGGVYGTHTVGPAGSSPGAAAVLAEWDWLIGPRPGGMLLMLWGALAGLLTAVCAGVVVASGWLLRIGTSQPTGTLAPAEGVKS